MSGLDGRPRPVLAPLFFAVTMPPHAGAVTPAREASVDLAPGAAAEDSLCAKVIRSLQPRCDTSVTTERSLTSMAGSAAAKKGVLSQQIAPPVLAPLAWSDMVTMQVGGDPNVEWQVYVAALLSEVDMSIASMLAACSQASSTDDLEFAEPGFLAMPMVTFARDFALRELPLLQKRARSVMQPISAAARGH